MRCQCGRPMILAMAQDAHPKAASTLRYVCYESLQPREECSAANAVRVRRLPVDGTYAVLDRSGVALGVVRETGVSDLPWEWATARSEWRGAAADRDAAIDCVLRHAE